MEETSIKAQKAGRWFVFVLVLGGLIWIGRSLLEFPEPRYWNPRTPLDYVAVVGTSLAFLSLSAVLWGLYRRYPLPTSVKQKLWLVGMALAILASAVVGVSNFIEDALGVNALGVMFGDGGLSLMLGLLLATIGAFLHPQIRRRLGRFLLACLVGIAFPDSSGGFIVGLAFLILAWMESR